MLTSALCNSSYVPPPKVRNKSKKAAAAAAAEEAEGEEERKAVPFTPEAKTLLALAASRESFREGSSKSPLYADSFYTNVSKGLLTAKHVSTSFDRTQTGPWCSRSSSTRPTRGVNGG